ncbi:MAG: T9SS type A sorting domain-containing protein [Phaeodactylibacter sp.]|nr:T9SS type A sorting domain-containing protein [Phaeodactylibacter sp.]
MIINFSFYESYVTYPASGTLWLMGKSESPVHFSLYNNRGQLAREWPLLQLPGEVPLTGLPAGIYFLHGTTGNRTFAHKIIKH